MSAPTAADYAAGALGALAELGGAGLIGFDAAEDAPPAAAGVLRVGLHRAGPLPQRSWDDVDILLTAEPGAPAPWVSAPDVDAALAALQAIADQQPAATACAAQVHRMTLSVPFAEAVALESLAYSMLLASERFRAWRAANPPRVRPAGPGPLVLIRDHGDQLELRLNRPEARNAVNARMRDALCEALAFAADHPDAPPVLITAEGPSFSAGGDLDEFGQAADPGVAHLIRAFRSAAHAVHRIAPRVTAQVHGACVGAGIEIPAAAGRIAAAPDAFFRLPEVSMGLIPGAGGTATIPRRVGRHRACWMAVSGAVVDAPTALHWGLVDEVRG